MGLIHLARRTTTSSYRRIIAVTIIGGLLLVAVAASQQRPFTLRYFLNVPDQNSSVPLYDNVTLTQHLHAPPDSLAGLTVFLTEPPTADLASPLILHVRSIGATHDLRTVMTTIGEVYEQTELPHHVTEGAITNPVHLLHFSFAPITDTAGNLEVALEAPLVRIEQTLPVAFQLDDTKYPNHELRINERVKEGDLGFILYEQPTLATLIGRWLHHPDNRLAWPALLLLTGSLAALGLFRYTRIQLHPSSFWTTAWSHVSVRIALLYSLLVALAIVVVFWPALNQFYFHDDLPILARTKQFTEHSPRHLFTAHRYVDPDPGTEPFSFVFYRPVSAALYPWLLLTLTNAHPTVAFIGNLLLYALIGITLYLLSLLLLGSYSLALVPTAVWAFHSSKLGVIYWWSSVQDVLASLFALVSLLLYTKLRMHPTPLRWLGALFCFAVALGSKEYVAALPLVFLALDAVFDFPARNDRRRWLWSEVYYLAPFLAILGLWLLLRTLALGDPTLPPLTKVDETYKMDFSFTTVARNLLVYSTWSAENTAWPNLNTIPAEALVQKWLSESTVQTPVYPGVLLAIALALLMLTHWSRPRQRALLIFAIGWWVLFLGPVLFLDSHWSPRYLTLSTWAVGLVIATSLTLPRLSRRQVHTSLSLLVAGALLCYGFQTARDPERTRLFVEQANYTKMAYMQFKHQEHKLTSDSTLHLVGVTPAQTTSLNGYLFRLISPQPIQQIIYSQTYPEQVTAHDIVIDMRGIIAQYGPY